jgi:hypothetical protein
MNNKSFKSIWLVAVLFLILACNANVSQMGVPTPTLVISSTGTAVPASSGMDISFSGTSFTIPNGLATGTTNEIKPRSQDDQGIPYIVNYPAYTHFQLQGYPLQGTLFEPQISVYPAKEYSQMNEAAGPIITNLQNILTAQRTSPADPIAFLPPQNASQVFHAQDKFISFKNGNGIRYITQFDQAPLPINNASMFYTYQGMTRDGEYYVSVIMPVNLEYLPADDKPNGPTPTNGIPFDWENISSFPNYLNQVVDRLNHTDNNFQPQLETLDALVQSLTVKP